ncbi:MAG: hypothetical protein HS123_23325 [Solibacteraceae bacterium]|nr:hypothetical protein [Solibacteraceae bacterium]
MVAKDLVLVGIQVASADEQKVSDVFFILPAPDGASAAATGVFEDGLGHPAFLHNDPAKSGVTGTKNGAKDTRARAHTTTVQQSQSEPAAFRTVRIGEGEGI